jgi:hypothetical protein
VNVDECEALLRSSQSAVNQFYMTFAQMENLALQKKEQQIEILIDNYAIMERRRRDRFLNLLD